MQWLVLVTGLVALLCVGNAFRPRHGRWSVIPGFFFAWYTTELPLHWLAFVGLVAALGISAGVAGQVAGFLGLVLLLGAAVGLVGLAREGLATREILRRALRELGGVATGGRYPVSHLVLPPLVHLRRGVRRVGDVPFARVAGQELRLDLTLPADARPGDGRPVLLQIHGGGWTLGYKRRQGQPLLNHLARQGWVGVNIDYRLSPGATFPDHLVDCKRALAWVRGHVADFGGDPDFVCVAGVSAGGHLAALMGLTANRPDLQPGFTAVDTTVQAVVPGYGVYDLTNRLGVWGPDVFRRLFEPWVIKAFLAEEPERFVAASPVDQVHAGAPPFLVLHGDRDVLVPVDDARLFVETLRAVSAQPVLYAELAGAQHAFDIFASLRSAAAVEATARFLVTVHRRSRVGVELDDLEDFEGRDDEPVEVIDDDAMTA